MADQSDEWKATWHEHAVVVAGFREWLEKEGWDVQTDVDHTDFVATRGEEKLFAEAKGLTSSGKVKGIPTLYGQILRRMKPELVADPKTSFGVVVPAKATNTALDWPEGIRRLLRITVYSVTDDGDVCEQA